MRMTTRQALENKTSQTSRPSQKRLTSLTMLTRLKARHSYKPDNPYKSASYASVNKFVLFLMIPLRSVKDKAEKEEVPADEFQELLRRANGLLFGYLISFQSLESSSPSSTSWTPPCKWRTSCRRRRWTPGSPATARISRICVSFKNKTLFFVNDCLSSFDQFPNCKILISIY